MPKVTFPQVNKTFEAPEGFSILEVALNNDIDLEHNCGGNCACSTCHVIVRKGFDLLPEMTEEEEDQLDEARDIELCSRLGCQARLLKDAGAVIRVQIPFWNVNLVQEGPDAAHAKD